ncbi:MAG: hypothetical protein IJM59_12245 [Proteobacteria bacterium]|nr:hypothetical protein [Pseudomonadota bacterium]
MAAEKTPKTETKKTRRRTPKESDSPILENAIDEQAAAAKDDAGESVSAVPDLPDVPENERVARYDVMITSERPGYKPPKVAFGTMVQQLAFRGFANPVDEAVAETWVEVYFEPGPAAHEVFLEKEYSSEEPVFHELVLRVQDKPFFCDYTDTPNRPLYWCIEFRGSRFRNPLGAFRKLFLDAFSLRIAVNSRDAQPAPEHRVVPEDELPLEKKKRERGAGLAGTDVEEM